MNRRPPFWSLLFAAMIFMTGCGDSSEPAPSLSISATSSTTASAAPAADAPMKDWIVGDWNGVVELNRETAAALPEMTPEAMATIESMTMTVTFTAAGEMKMAATMETPAGDQQSESSASWEVVETDGNHLKIKSQEEGHDPEEVAITRIDGNRFSMPAPQNVGAMVFTRRR